MIFKTKAFNSLSSSHLFLGDGRESDGVLVVLAQVEVAREPRLDAAVLADLM